MFCDIVLLGGDMYCIVLYCIVLCVYCRYVIALCDIVLWGVVCDVVVLDCCCRIICKCITYLCMCVHVV